MESFLDKYGVALRSGRHCAHPMLDALNLSSVVRVSPAFYNTFEEIDLFVEYLNKTISFLHKYR